MFTETDRNGNSVSAETYCYEMKVIEALSWAIFVMCTYLDVGLGMLSYLVLHRSCIFLLDSGNPYDTRSRSWPVLNLDLVAKFMVADICVVAFMPGENMFHSSVGLVNGQLTQPKQYIIVALATLMVHTPRDMSSLQVETMCNRRPAIRS